MLLYNHGLLDIVQDLLLREIFVFIINFYF